MNLIKTLFITLPRTILCYRITFVVLGVFIFMGKGLTQEQVIQRLISVHGNK